MKAALNKKTHHNANFHSLKHDLQIYAGLCTLNTKLISTRVCRFRVSLVDYQTMDCTLHMSTEYCYGLHMILYIALHQFFLVNTTRCTVRNGFCFVCILSVRKRETTPIGYTVVVYEFSPLICLASPIRVFNISLSWSSSFFSSPTTLLGRGLALSTSKKKKDNYLVNIWSIHTCIISDIFLFFFKFLTTKSHFCLPDRGVSS